MTPFGELVHEIRHHSDADLVDFDWVGVWRPIQLFYRPFSSIFHHHGSDSWGDHLGIGKRPDGTRWNDNPVKRRRRAVASWLSGGETDRWARAAGLGSPPD